MKVGGFIIHLARAKSRRANVEHLQRTLPMPTTIIDAVDGALLSDADKAAVYTQELHHPRYPFVLSASEIGCFLSHRRAWQALLDSEFDAGFFVEDDVVIDLDRLRPGLRIAQPHCARGTLVRFPFRAGRDHGRTLERLENTILIADRHPGLGMQAQLMDRKAAAALLYATRVFDRPVDTFVQTHWNHPVRILAVHPSGIGEIGDALGGSFIQNRAQGLRSRLERTVARARYRLRIRARGGLV